MSKFLALSAVFMLTSASDAFAQAVFDSPGPGYRQHRDRLTPAELRTPAVGGVLVEPISRSRDSAKARAAVFHQLWQNSKDPAAPKLETVALFSSGVKGASEKIRRALTDAGIPYLVEGRSPVVKVDPSRAAEAKTLLKKLATEGSWTLRTVTVADDQLILDGGE